jgi:hypothetical protein
VAAQIAQVASEMVEKVKERRSGNDDSENDDNNETPAAASEEMTPELSFASSVLLVTAG